MSPRSSATAIEFRPAQPGDHEAIRQLLTDAGWGERVKDPQRIRAYVERASRTVVAVDDTRVVGFVRALCDDVSNGYISMLVVAEGLRGRGIGRGLVERITADPDQGRITWVLRAGRGSAGFWERMGFQRSDCAMERVRTR